MNDKPSFRQAVSKYLNTVKNNKDPSVCLVWRRKTNTYEHWTRKQISDNQESLNSRTNHLVMWLTVSEASSLTKQFELPV